MASDGSNMSASGRLIAWLGGQLAALVSGEDLRVRNLIAGGVAHARSSHDAEMTSRWYARHTQATKMRGE